MSTEGPQKSWIESANAAESHFPLQNLPYGIFSDGDAAPRPGVAIGDQIVDLRALEAAGLLRPGLPPVFDTRTLNAFMARPQAEWDAVRQALTALLAAGARPFDQRGLGQAVRPAKSARLHLPVYVRSFTDFYSSRAHATNVGTILRGADAALSPNWLHIPIAYNGRASSVVVSGTDVRRPLGQLMDAGASAPRFGPCERLDFELELGTVVGTPSPMGRPLSVAEAQEAIFGFVLVNDWSARDIQAWEYRPLGPFQSKAFATSISPWVVPRAALEAFRVPAPDREVPLLPYLEGQGDLTYDIDLEVSLQPEGGDSEVISRTNARNLYYAPAQQLAHHAACGCPMETGDLLGSGTISGPERGSEGSLLELAWNAQRPLRLASGAERSFLADGDTLILTGWCQGGGHRVGFGTCEGTIVPAPPPPGA